MSVWNWIKERLGYHVCREFTQWQSFTKDFQCYNTRSGVLISEYPVTKRWEERRCTLCGKLQQHELDN